MKMSADDLTEQKQQLGSEELFFSHFIQFL